MLVFERERNVCAAYFIEYPPTQSFSFTGSDTLKIIGIGIPGCDARNVLAFRDYLRTLYSFDSVPSIPLTWDETPITDTFHWNLEYKRGYIVYYNSDPYKMAKSFDKKKINNKDVVFESEDYIHIIEFISDPIKKKKQARRRI